MFDVIKGGGVAAAPHDTNQTLVFLVVLITFDIRNVFRSIYRLNLDSYLLEGTLLLTGRQLIQQ